MFVLTNKYLVIMYGFYNDKDIPHVREKKEKMAENIQHKKTIVFSVFFLGNYIFLGSPTNVFLRNPPNITKKKTFLETSVGDP